MVQEHKRISGLSGNEIGSLQKLQEEGGTQHHQEQDDKRGDQQPQMALRNGKLQPLGPWRWQPERAFLEKQFPDMCFAHAQSPSLAVARKQEGPGTVSRHLAPNQGPLIRMWNTLSSSLAPLNF